MRAYSTTPTFAKIAFGVILMPQESHFSLRIVDLYMNNLLLSPADIFYLQASYTKKACGSFSGFVPHMWGSALLCLKFFIRTNRIAEVLPCNCPHALSWEGFMGQ